MATHEFDELIASYREEQNRAIALSGENAEFFAEYKVRKLCEWLPELAARPVRVLDYGASDGLMTSFVAKHFPKAEVFGIDPSAKSIAEARARYPELKLFVLEGKTLPFAAQTFDLVFTSGVFHHIPFAEHRLWLGEIFRTLKPDGSFVLFEMNPWNPFSVYVFYTCPIDRNARFLFPGYARRLLASSGTLTIKYYAFFPRWLAWLRPLEPGLTRLPLGALYVAICRKPIGVEIA